MLQITFSSLSKTALNTYKTYLLMHLTQAHIPFKCANLPKIKRKYTLLKSPHVNKKAKETFESVQYKFILVLKPNKKYFNVLKNNLPKF